MGTRGNITLIFKQKVVKLYNHWDSYPSGLGESLVQQLNLLLSKMTLEKLIQKLDTLKIVTKDVIPTDEDIKKLSPYTSLDVSTQNTDDWYCLMRGCQGYIPAMIESGYLFHQDYDGEYNYVLDFDSKKFYLGESDVIKFDIDNIPLDWIDLIA